MFIREYKTHNKKTNETYIKHRLVESYWTEKGSRQRIVMNLGQLTIPRMEWKKLAHALEQKLAGQETLLGAVDKDIEMLALKLISSNELSKATKAGDAQSGKASQANARWARINLDSVRTFKARSLGAEMVCAKAWDMLGFGSILKSVGMGEREVALSRAVIFGRLISPGSERHTIEWFRNRTALPELDGADISGCGKDAYYSIGDSLYAAKDALEEMLYRKEREYFPHGATTVFLYDLTNTYMEGSCLGNDMAEYGHCKSKRSDCPLITLSIVVADDGMPVVSHIYKGNQSEPETMEDMIGRLEGMFWGRQMPLAKPTVAMDRGIATKDNIDYLKDKGYPYVVIRREDASATYRDMFVNGRESFDVVSNIEGKASVYGDVNKVYAKKIGDAESGTCEVLCISDGKARKEMAIDAKKEKRFVDDIIKLNTSIAKGSIKNAEKIKNRLDRILGRHKLAASMYDTAVNGINGKVADITCKKKDIIGDKLYGCYVIETTHTELSHAEIWNLYMRLTKVESAFRAMKSELGMRPVFHQTGQRTEAHLFITVLAYHILATIENLLARQGDTRQWSTIRDVLSTHMRSTVVATDDSGVVHHIRTSGIPESSHADIYAKLGVKDNLRTMVSLVKAVPSDP